jgi:hypothetical protein
MNRADYPKFAIAISGMAATFRQEVTEAILTGYRMGLDDLPIESIERAVARALQDCRFMPSVAELRDLAGHLSPSDRAIRAWDVAVHANHLHGYYESVDFDDKVINATIRSMGGWERFCERFEEEDAKWIRKEFERLYASFCRSGLSPEAAGPLVGFCDRSNAGLGFFDHVKSPLLIECGLPPHPDGIVPLLQDGNRQKQTDDLIQKAVDQVGLLPHDSTKE